MMEVKSTVIRATPGDVFYLVVGGNSPESRSMAHQARDSSNTLFRRCFAKVVFKACHRFNDDDSLMAQEALHQCTLAEVDAIYGPVHGRVLYGWEFASVEILDDPKLYLKYRSEGGGWLSPFAQSELKPATLFSSCGR